MHFECLESKAAVGKEVHFCRSLLHQHRMDLNILNISELMALPYNYSIELDIVEQSASFIAFSMLLVAPELHFL